MRVSYRKLWILCAQQDISKAELRKRAGLAPATFTKLRRDQEVNLSVLIRIAGVLDCAARSMRAGGRLWMEIGAGQSEAVRALCAARPLGNVEILRDYAGHPRVVCAVKRGL